LVAKICLLKGPTFSRSCPEGLAVYMLSLSKDLLSTYCLPVTRFKKTKKARLELLCSQSSRKS